MGTGEVNKSLQNTNILYMHIYTNNNNRRQLYMIFFLTKFTAFFLLYFFTLHLSTLSKVNIILLNLQSGLWIKHHKMNI